MICTDRRVFSLPVTLFVAAALLFPGRGALAQPSPDAPVETKPAADPVSAPAASVAEVRALRDAVKALQKKVGELTEKKEADELSKLMAEAEAEAKAPKEGAKPAEREFLWGALALQKLNPEISVSADVLAQVIFDGDAFYAGRDDRSSMPIRELGLHFQHVLDPFSTFKAALNFIPWPDAEAELEEVYITWSGVVPALSFTVGRFRQTFGQVNRWHEHDLDQTEYPLALQLALGPEGIVGSGLSVKWFLPPLWAHALELTFQLTDGENETLFAGEYFSVPSMLLHLKNYWDLSESVYLEFGLTGMYGVNNRRGYVPDGGAITDEPWRHTVVSGADMTLQWSPLRQAKYRSLTWRTEGYLVYKETPDDPRGERWSWGVYSYLDYQLATRWFAGVRFDAGQPTIRQYCGDDAVAWDLVPYITFWQSEFVYLRLEYRHGQNVPYRDDETGAQMRRTDNRLLLQIDFAAGPHKHEKY